MAFLQPARRRLCSERDWEGGELAVGMRGDRRKGVSGALLIGDTVREVNHMTFRIGVAMLLVVSAAHAATTVRLMEPLKTDARHREPLQPLVLQRETVKVSLEFPKADRLIIPLFHRTVIARRDKLEFAADEATWAGHIINEPESAVLLAIVEDSVSGTIIRGDGTQYRIRMLHSGVHVLERINNSRSLPEEGPPSHAKPCDPPQQLLPMPPVPACTTDTKPIIDLLVLYTKHARQAAGGPSKIQSLINLAALETNWSFSHSRVKAAVRVVHKEEVTDPESGFLEQDRDALQAAGDGVFDAAQQLREDYGADAVFLIVENGDRAGQSLIMEKASADFESKAFSVVLRENATDNFSFTHELGHLMGARHEWSADCTNDSPFASNHGYVRLHPNFGRKPWRTIMATSNECIRVNALDCRRILRWSDPSARLLTGDRLGAGEPTPTDNHSALNQTALIVAQFRCHK
ncbi:MAG: hypothetical protein JO093_07585 [Acidobacteria bacterium]|nr:hypothetical protein [Acidobacteriota bacterium]MBV9070101.1 hypothetical protein [Acidobacteriota bacterium]MBV9185466.1 hypothetical protein [Acidobacteriota bacterium]